MLGNNQRIKDVVFYIPNVPVHEVGSIKNVDGARRPVEQTTYPFNTIGNQTLADPSSAAIAQITSTDANADQCRNKRRRHQTPQCKYTNHFLHWLFDVGMIQLRVAIISNIS